MPVYELGREQVVARAEPALMTAKGRALPVKSALTSADELQFHFEKETGVPSVQAHAVEFRYRPIHTIPKLPPVHVHPLLPVKQLHPLVVWQYRL
jgi:hypothetical protein